VNGRPEEHPGKGKAKQDGRKGLSGGTSGLTCSCTDCCAVAWAQLQKDEAATPTTHHRPHGDEDGGAD